MIVGQEGSSCMEGGRIVGQEEKCMDGRKDRWAGWKMYGDVSSSRDSLFQIFHSRLLSNHNHKSRHGYMFVWLADTIVVTS